MGKGLAWGLGWDGVGWLRMKNTIFIYPPKLKLYYLLGDIYSVIW